MTDSISIDTAKKLGEAILRFGIHAKIVAPDVSELTGPQLLQILDDASDLITAANELIGAAKDIGEGIEVEIFWERQGFYFVELGDRSKVSREFETLDDCVRHIVLHGYTLMEFHRTRRSVPQPIPSVPSRKPSDAE